MGRKPKAEASIARVAALAMMGRTVFVGPLSVSLRFRIKPPKSMPKKLRAAVLAGEVAYMGSVDVDNMAKAVLDAMNKVCFADDRQVMRLFATKVASDSPGIDVKITSLEPETR
jgi:Holliday junction resolvase RusA-like endonuclease